MLNPITQRPFWDKEDKSSRKLISTMNVSGAVKHIALIRWLIDHGVEMYNVEYIVMGYSKACFKPFLDFTTDGRREADKTDNKISSGNA